VVVTVSILSSSQVAFLQRIRDMGQLIIHQILNNNQVTHHVEELIKIYVEFTHKINKSIKFFII
jgi:hypothetical protein